MVEAQLQNIHTRRAFHARTQAVLTNPDTSWCCFRLVGDSSKTSLELRIFKVFSYTGPFPPCLVTVGLIHVGSGPITPSNPLKLRRGSPALPFLWCGSRAGDVFDLPTDEDGSCHFFGARNWGCFQSWLDCLGFWQDSQLVGGLEHFYCSIYWE